MPRQPTWTHEKVLKYKADYRSMCIRLGIPLENVERFGDEAEILQAIDQKSKGEYKVVWISGPMPVSGHTVCDVKMDISSRTDPKSRKYEVGFRLDHVGGDLFDVSPNAVEHTCKASQFTGYYRHRGGVTTYDFHEIEGIMVLGEELPFWCRRRKKPEIRIEKRYVDVPEPHKTELLKILNEEGSQMKSLALREKIHIYLVERDLKLYGVV